MDWTLIITPVLGAVIAYFTNWIAIKMLFRPYEQKQIFGLRLPFTPGLIPKEKPRLARQMGETLSRNVLTEEELVKAVTAPEVTDKLAALLDGFLDEFRAGAYDEQLESFCRVASEKLTAVLTDQNGAVNAVFSGIIRKTAEGLGPKIAEAFQKDDFRQNIESLLQKILGSLRENEKELGEYLGPELLPKAKDVILEKHPELVNFLKDLPRRFPDIDDAISALIHNIAERNFGTFLGIFIRYDQLYDKIKNSLFEYLDNPDNARFLAEKGQSFLASLFQKPVREIIGMTGDALDRAVSGAAHLIKISQDSGAAESITDWAVEKARGINPALLISKFIPDPEASINSVLKGILNAMTESLNEENTVKLRNYALGALGTITRRGGAYVVANMRFDTLIENKINSFSVQETENLILSVVRKELKAIIALGGVLGFVIGCMALIMNLIG